MRRLRAFTLIELLVVIAIIAILAAILFPVFAQAREAARKATCQSNLKQIATAVMMYAQDFDEITPHTAPDYNAWGTKPIIPGSPNCPTPRWLLWVHLIHAYTKNVGILTCPSSDYRYPTPATCASNRWYHPFGGYGGNPWVFNRNLSEFEKPADTILSLDNGSNTNRVVDGYPVYRTHYYLAWWGDSFGFNATTTHPRHSGVSNVAFLDGHVKAMKTAAIRAPLGSPATYYPWTANGGHPLWRVTNKP